MLFITPDEEFKNLFVCGAKFITSLCESCILEFDRDMEFVVKNITEYEKHLCKEEYNLTVDLKIIRIGAN